MWKTVSDIIGEVVLVLSGMMFALIVAAYIIAM